MHAPQRATEVEPSVRKLIGTKSPKSLLSEGRSLGAASLHDIGFHLSKPDCFVLIMNLLEKRCSDDNEPRFLQLSGTFDQGSLVWSVVPIRSGRQEC